MLVAFTVGIFVSVPQEMGGNPHIDEMGIAQDLGSMEGKEIRIGSAARPCGVWVTTVTSNRFRQLDARQLHAHRRHGTHGAHAARRGHRRRRGLRHCGCPSPVNSTSRLRRPQRGRLPQQGPAHPRGRVQACSDELRVMTDDGSYGTKASSPPPSTSWWLPATSTTWSSPSARSS